MDGQYNRMVWRINTRTIPRCFGKSKMASNNESGIGHLRALVPWLLMMVMMILVKFCMPMNLYDNGTNSPWDEQPLGRAFGGTNCPGDESSPKPQGQFK